MEYYFPLLEKIVNQIIVIYFDKFNKFSQTEKIDYQIKLTAFDQVVVYYKDKDSKLDIYAGELNTERIKAYRKLYELYNLEETTIAKIFCAGADWGVDVALSSKK